MSLDSSPNKTIQRPHFIGHNDEPWIQSLLDEYQRFEGRPIRDWHQRLKEPLPFYHPRRKLRFVIKAFDEMFSFQKSHPRKKIQEMRHELFQLSENFPYDNPRDLMERRSNIIGNLSGSLISDAEERGESFEHILFSDLRSERLLAPIPADTSISDLILAANTYLIKSIIQRSQRIDISLRGKLRPIVRQASLRGLICVAHTHSGSTEFDAFLSLSGPLGLFRHTKLYGRLLTEIVPFLPLTDRFSLKAFVPERDQMRIWTIQSGDPIRQASTQKFDSQIERNFFRDFCKVTSDFDLIREPQAVAVDDRIIFPDFAIRHRTNCEQFWLLEIVGYWTNAYLQKKIESLQQAKIKNLIICVSRKLGCSDQWPSNAQLIFFDRWVDPSEVLRAMGGQINGKAVFTTNRESCNAILASSLE